MAKNLTNQLGKLNVSMKRIRLLVDDVGIQQGRVKSIYTYNEQVWLQRRHQHGI